MDFQRPTNSIAVIEKREGGRWMGGTAAARLFEGSDVVSRETLGFGAKTFYTSTSQLLTHSRKI
jgi:hypothetical protein